MSIIIHRQTHSRGWGKCKTFYALIVNHAYIDILFDSRESLNDCLEAL
jgi:hypothetical protein